MSRSTVPKATKLQVIKIILAIYLGVILLILLSWGIHFGWHTAHLYHLFRGFQADISQIQPDTLVSTIEAAAGDIQAIHRDLTPLYPIFNAFQALPVVGPYLDQVEPWMIYADGLSQAGEEIAVGIKPLISEVPSEQASLTLLERISQVVSSNQTHFVSAAQAVDRASWVRQQLRPELLPNKIRPLYLLLDGNFDLLASGMKILQAAPQLLGAQQVQSYLVLAQNRDELRATGGFISGIGLLTVQDGKILEFTLADSYQIDDFSKSYPQPPEPLHRFMLADYWVTRDANWSPDYPTTAQEAQSLHTLSTGIQTQGVIAFNQLVIQRVLKVIGPVQVLGTDEPICSENVGEYMRQAWAPAPEQGLSPEWWLHRKDFMQLLGGVILEKALSNGNPQQLLNLGRVMLELLDQGQLLVYFNDPSVQSVINTTGWDGALQPGTGDYLYWVDSNVGFNKVDSVIQRSLAYHVDLSELEHPMGEASMTYQHSGSGKQACKQEISYGTGTYQDMQQRCYLDYWRIYVPGGSELLAGNAQPIPADALLNGLGWSGQVESLPGEAVTQVFAGLLMLPPSQSTQIILSYSLPSRIIQPAGINLQEYTLSVQVQSGLDGLPFQLEIKLPSNASLLNPGEGWMPLTAETWTWQGLLNKSIELSLFIQSNPYP